jgi:hypothetical protein
MGEAGCQSFNGIALVERSPEKDGVGGSIPSLATIIYVAAILLQVLP